MKLLWIDLNCSYAHSSLALPALHAQVMDRKEVDWQVVRTTINENVGAIVETIYRHRPDVIAATAWLFTHEHLLHIIGRVKSLLPDVTVILGGPEFLGDNRAYLSCHREVDVLLRGEGEESFARWLEVWNQPEYWADIPGLCYLSEETYRDGGLARVMDFEKLVSPEESRFFILEKPFVQIETTRGCFNSCTFCVSGLGDPIRTLPIETTRQRLQRIAQAGIRDVRILDRTFNYNPRRALSLLGLFREFHPHLRFHLEIHPALLPQSVRDELALLPEGLLHLEAGIQSLREEVLNKCQRVGGLQNALNGLRFLCSLPNLVTHADLIAGLPLYTLAQIYEDIRTLAGFHVGEIQLELLKLLPGTAMCNRAEEFGIKYAPLPPYEVLATDEISPTELQEARRLSRLLDAYYNTKAWQSLVRTLIVREEGFLSHFLCYLTENNYIEQPMSLERRGELLYLFCKNHYPDYQVEAVVSWIEAGLSLKKRPAEKVLTGRLQPASDWEVVYGEYSETLRLCFLPFDREGKGYWFGYDTTAQRPAPIFKAIGRIQGASS
ncbi:MAG: DUF4080 domain-containing protein [Bacteroidaceae bacterium]|nr:DUF4080 domain-containing protein [Bacteroidaceae bacterium]